MDAVINHAGYATLADLQQDAVQVVNAPMLPERWNDWKPSADETGTASIKPLITKARIGNSGGGQTGYAQAYRAILRRAAVTSR